MGITSKASRDARRKKIRKEHDGRIAHHEHAMSMSDKILEMYKIVDPEDTKHISTEQVGQLLQLLNKDDGEKEMDEATLLSAVTFVMRCADEDESGGIDKDEVPTAIAAWTNWATTHDSLGETVRCELKKIDKDMSGSLDREELMGLLTNLNNGVEGKGEIVLLLLLLLLLCGHGRGVFFFCPSFLFLSIVSVVPLHHSFSFFLSLSERLILLTFTLTYRYTHTPPVLFFNVHLYFNIHGS